VRTPRGKSHDRLVPRTIVDLGIGGLAQPRSIRRSWNCSLARAHRGRSLAPVATAVTVNVLLGVSRDFVGHQ
jgi:hypothetical protein